MSGRRTDYLQAIYLGIFPPVQYRDLAVWYAPFNQMGSDPRGDKKARSLGRQILNCGLVEVVIVIMGYHYGIYFRYVD